MCGTLHKARRCRAREHIVQSVTRAFRSRNVYECERLSNISRVAKGVYVAIVNKMTNWTFVMCQPSAPPHVSITVINAVHITH